MYTCIVGEGGVFGSERIVYNVSAPVEGEGAGENNNNHKTEKGTKAKKKQPPKKQRKRMMMKQRMMA